MRSLPHVIVAISCIIGAAIIIPVTISTINSNAVRVRPPSSTHDTAGDRSPVARHLSLESAK